MRVNACPGLYGRAVRRPSALSLLLFYQSRFSSRYILELNGRILKKFDKEMGEFVGGQKRPAERKQLSSGRCTKTFLYHIARFTARFMIKFPPME